jgi:outer membrane immunogenic protein
MRRSAIGSIAVVALTTAYAAMAADLAPAYKASPIVPSVPWTWTGLYLGGHIGNGWGQHVFEHTQSERETAPREIMTFSPPETLPISVDGLLAGTQLGYRYQSSPWVWGVEGDLDWTDIRGGTSCGDSDICQSKAHWLATIAGEIGWTADHALLYLKGGAAAIQEVHSASRYPNHRRYLD